MVKDAILGLVVGDALGVPVEFESRVSLAKNPVKTMREYGTYHQPKGTWSDDSSLTLCLMEALTKGYDLVGIAKEFIAWKMRAKWTPHDRVFDIGMTTSHAINTLIKIFEEGDYDALNYLYFEADEYSNGNGSLMRILPLYFYLKDKELETNFDKIWAVSALTHGHIRAALCCLYYLILLDELIAKKDKSQAYSKTQIRFNHFLKERQINPNEQQLLKRLCQGNIADLEEAAIKSDGYVLHSLEAVVWCLMRYNGYPETVLAAVNLGGDTDTTAAIVGGLAGALYGLEQIPEEWMKVIVRLGDIEALCERFEGKLSIPRILYKYRDWSNILHKRILKNNELYFAAPIDFEDELDCNIPMDYASLTEDEIFDRYLRLMNEIHPFWTENRRKIEAKCWIRKGLLKNKKHIKKVTEENWKKVNKVFGVLSLTPKPYSDLMWEKYGNNHKGICIGFNTDILVQSSYSVGNQGKIGSGGFVNYHKNLPSIHPFEDRIKKWIKTTFNKKETWAFEEEYRLTKMYGDEASLEDRIFKFQSNAIVEVILGKEMEKSERNEIIKIISKKFPEAKILDS